MASIGEAVLDIIGNTQPFENALGGLDRTATGAFKRMGSTIGKTVVGGLKVAAVATVGIGAAAVTAGVQYNRLGQRVTAALTTLLGTRKAAQGLIKDVATLARTSPFPRQAFLAATQQLVGFGLEAGKVVSTLDAIQNAVAATGGTAQDLEEIVDVFARIQGQGKITGAELNRLGIRGIDAAQLIGDAMGKTGEEIRAAISSGAIDADTAIAALVKSMDKRFGGAAEGLKNTFEGALDRVKGALRDLGSAIVEPFIGFEEGGAAVDGLNAIADALRHLEKVAVPKLQKKLKPLTDSLAAFTSGAAGRLPGFIDKLSAGFTKLGAATGPLTGAFLGLGGAALTRLIPGIAGLGGPAGVAIGLFAGMLASSEPFRTAVLNLGKALLDLAERALPPLLPAFDALAKAAGQIGAVVFQALADVLVSLTPAIVALATALTPLIVALADFVTLVVRGLGPALPVILNTALALVALKKALAITAAVQAFAAAIGLIGPAAATAAGATGVGGLVTKLGALKAIGRIVIPIIIAIEGLKALDKLTGEGASFGDKLRELFTSGGAGQRIQEITRNAQDAATAFGLGEEASKRMISALQNLDNQAVTLTGFKRIREDLDLTAVATQAGADIEKVIQALAGGASRAQVASQLMAGQFGGDIAKITAGLGKIDSTTFGNLQSQIGAVATSFGLSEETAKALQAAAQKAGNVSMPTLISNLRTTLDELGVSKGKADEVVRALQTVGAQRPRPVVEIQDRASGPLDGILGKLRSIVGRAWNAVVGTVTRRHEGGLIMHAGGLVPRLHEGAFLSVSEKLKGDERLAILQTGELVLSRTDVARLRGLLMRGTNVGGLRRHAGGLIMHSGGLVPSSGSSGVGSFGAMASRPTVVNVQGSVVTDRELTDRLERALVRAERLNGGSSARVLP